MDASCSHFLNEFDDAPPGTLDFSFGVREEDEVSIATMEGELMPSDVDDSSVLPPSGVTPQSEVDTELTAMLSWGVVKGWTIGSWVWSVTLRHTPPQCHFSGKCTRRS